MDFDSHSPETSDLKRKLTKHREIPRLSVIEKNFERLSPGERLILYILTGVFVLSVFALFSLTNAAVSVTVPSSGGSLTEGLVGPARFINPVLALSGPDKDLAMLVYSGLMRARPNGDLVPDLASSYEVSEDGTIYTFTLKEGLTFHDGKPLSADDVLFTIQHVQNPEIKSARRADWEGVLVSAPDAHTVIFTLPHAYAPFLENTTLGILPKHLWADVSGDEFPFDPLNTRPIGSGPYRVTHVDTNSTGAATRYELESFSDFALEEPHLTHINFIFFPNEEILLTAFNAGRIDSLAGISPAEIEKVTRSDVHIAHVPLPRTFAVFFNQNKNTIFADYEVRLALSQAVDKQQIIDEVLKGYGAPLDGPIPPGILGQHAPAIPEPLVQKASTDSDATENPNLEESKTTLTKGLWKFVNASSSQDVWKKKDAILELTLATADEPTLAASAEAVAARWRALGVKVDVHVYPVSELNSVVLRPRNYDAVLFGEVVGRTLDLFAFWHSSQRNDPGLNLALYTNTKADTLLSKARSTTGKSAREKLYAQFADYVKEDQPATFLYAPEFIYLVPKELGGVELGALSDPSERFLNAYEWYTDTERVWNIFTDKTEH